MYIYGFGQHSFRKLCDTLRAIPVNQIAMRFFLSLYFSVDFVSEISTSKMVWPILMVVSNGFWWSGFFHSRLINLEIVYCHLTPNNKLSFVCRSNP